MGVTVVTSAPGVTPGGYTVSLSDFAAQNVGTSVGGISDAMSADEAEAIFDKFGLVARIGRGVTNTNITYIALKNENGVLSYLYPNIAGTGLIVAGAKP